ILAILMRLRQICCHLDLLKEHHKPGAYGAPSAKLDAFFELLDEAMDGGHRILVFSQFVSMLKLLREELEQRGLTYCYLDGSTQDRLEQCQRFNLQPAIPVFLISLKAGGTGLNLTGADMVVHFDPWWNPAVEDQATDRAHRIGQKRTVYSIKLIAEHTVEEKVLAMQQKKQSVINATVGVTDESVMQKLTFDDIRDLIGL
ncbi:MAG: C-terminal helicase domain-containing protein, partial [Kiritimatiellae bacterium]|nr:C-terminal helicase domain-containing protein [Kiritimatiellia bacterium]